MGITTNIYALFLLPVFALLSIFFLYRYSGRRQFLHFDSVQFIYSFVIFPLLYLWLKNLLYFLVRKELGVIFSIGEWIAIESVFSIFFLYFYAFGIIHSLTKTFALQVDKDPFFDVFAQSEYIHEFLSHVAMYLIAAVILLILSFCNALIPLAIPNNHQLFQLILLFAVFMGTLAYFGIFHVTQIKLGPYRRAMKLVVATSFALHFLIYFIFDPGFSIQSGLFWFNSVTVVTVIGMMFLVIPIRRMIQVYRRVIGSPSPETTA